LLLRLLPREGLSRRAFHAVERVLNQALYQG
jgi:hypothetical protein